MLLWTPPSDRKGLRNCMSIDQYVSMSLCPKKILEKMPKNSSKLGFFGFCQKIKPLVCHFFTRKMVHNDVLYDSAKTASWGKSWFFMTEYAPSQSDSSIPVSSVSLEGINQYLRLFAWR